MRPSCYKTRVWHFGTAFVNSEMSCKINVILTLPYNLVILLCLYFKAQWLGTYGYPSNSDHIRADEDLIGYQVSLKLKSRVTTGDKFRCNPNKTLHDGSMTQRVPIYHT